MPDRQPRKRTSQACVPCGQRKTKVRLAAPLYTVWPVLSREHVEFVPSSFTTNHDAQGYSRTLRPKFPSTRLSIDSGIKLRLMIAIVRWNCACLSRLREVAKALLLRLLQEKQGVRGEPSGHCRVSAHPSCNAYLFITDRNGTTMSPMA